MTHDPAPRLWDRHRLNDPHHQADKADRVRRMFAAIAPSYDLNNRVHSLWQDQAWRRAAVAAAAPRPTDVVLDIACGTGDLAMAFARAGVQQVTGVDFTFDMLSIARKKLAAAGRDAPPLQYHAGDAMRLPFADASADIVSIAFGIRNVAEPTVALREFARVLRPGGRLVILEFAMPANRLLRRLYQTYFHHVLPRTAALIARDRSGAYAYLPKSVSTFIAPSTMLELIAGAGFEDVSARRLTFGIAVVYRGVRL